MPIIFKFEDDPKISCIILNDFLSETTGREKLFNYKELWMMPTVGQPMAHRLFIL